MSTIVGVGVGPGFPGSVRIWDPKVDAATMWIDLSRGHYTTSGGKFTDITDESGNSHGLSQANAALQAVVGTSGPGGGASMGFDNATMTYAVAGNVGAGTDHTIVVGGSLLHSPGTTNAIAGWVQKTTAAPYFAADHGDTADAHMGVRQAAGWVWKPSGLVSPTGGVHCWIWVVNGATGKCRCYLDGVADAADIDCAAFAFTTAMAVGRTGTAFAPDGTLHKLAYWNSALNAAQLANAAAWAVR